MSDLVERLRDAAALPNGLYAEAADEITRLRSENEAFRDAWNKGDWPITFRDSEITRLREELETERMRLAACGVIALSNTRKSAEQQRQMKPEYWCASVKDVCDAVDREMTLREELELTKMGENFHDNQANTYARHVAHWIGEYEKLNLSLDEYRADNIRLAQERDELVAALEHVIEYWNGSNNETAMHDALTHIDDVAHAALAKVKGEGA